jgi:uncharacterized protein
MTPQETQLLQAFLDRLTQTQATHKDSDAEQRIAQAVAKQPDAAYLLTQRALILEQAVENAQNQITQLQAEVQALKATQAVQAPQTNSGFLSADSGWGRSAQISPPKHNTSNTTTFGTQQIGASSYAAPARGGFLSGGTGSMLGTVAATAAGVAAGAFLFQGLGNLMGNNSPETNNSATDTSNNLDHNQSSTTDAGTASLNDGGSDGLIPNYFEEDSDGGDFGGSDESM